MSIDRSVLSLAYRDTGPGGGGQPAKAEISHAAKPVDGEPNDPSQDAGVAHDDEAAKRESEATKSAEHVVIAEAEVLAQHAGETLLRLYLAHEYPPGGPPDPRVIGWSLPRQRSGALVLSG